MDPHTACRVLGVAIGASDAEVKSAYRKCALQFHPDRNAGCGKAAERLAAESFRKAAEAYALLSGGGGGGRGGRSGSSSTGGGGYSGGGYRSPHQWSSQNGGKSSNGQGSSGYYGGANDPFGFRTKNSQTVGDHMRRIDRNIRTLYISLAVVGVCIYLVPSEKSPVEIAKRRKQKDKPTYTYTEKATASLAPGSPLDSDYPGSYRQRDRSTFRDTNRSDSNRGGDPSRMAPNHHRDDDAYSYCYDGGGASSDDAVFASATTDANRTRLNAHRYQTIGEMEHTHAMRQQQGAADEDGDLITQEDRPDWASGGYSGRGISKRVLPYWRRTAGRQRTFDDDDTDGIEPGTTFGSVKTAHTTLHCARCASTLAIANRYCSICGAKVTSPASVVVSGNFNGGDGQKSQKRNPNVQTASPLPDPQDTGLSAGRGAARARAERNADTGGGE